MFKQYENDIILPPVQFRDNYVRKKPVPLPRIKKEKPIPAERSDYLFKFDDILFDTT